MKLSNQVKETVEKWVPSVGEAYRIHKVEYKVSDGADKLPYLRVVVVTPNHSVQNLTLWLANDQVRAKSLTGCFIGLLGDETDDWADKFIRFTSYGRNSNAIEFVPAEEVEKIRKSAERKA